MQKPNFLIVGAAKSGTTSLARYIAEHEEIFIPELKELRFFAAEVISNTSVSDPSYKYLMSSSVLDEENYFNLFKGRKEKKLGEASIHYLYHYDSVIPKIQKYLGDIKIIIILRNPITRAISNWKYQEKDFLSFGDSLKAERYRESMGYNSFWYYKKLGLYYYQVKAYLDSFSDVEVILFDDFVYQTGKSVEKVFNFLGVNKSSQISYSKSYNKTGIAIRPKTRLLRKVLTTQKRVNFFLKCYKNNLVPYFLVEKKDQLIQEREKKRLKRFYKDDLQKLEKLIQKDLTHWYK